MEEEGAGALGAPAWDGTGTIWPRGRCLGACQIGRAGGGGAERGSERRCRRVNHGAPSCLRSARPMPGPEAGPCAPVPSPVEVPGLLQTPRLLSRIPVPRRLLGTCTAGGFVTGAGSPPADADAPQAPRHRHCFIVGTETSSLRPSPSTAPVSPGPFGSVCRRRECCEKAIWLIQLALGAES